MLDDISDLSDLSDLTELSGEDEPMPFDPLPGVSKLPVNQYATIPAAINTPKTRRGGRSKLYREEQAKRREKMRETDMKKKQELTGQYLFFSSCVNSLCHACSDCNANRVEIL